MEIFDSLGLFVIKIFQLYELHWNSGSGKVTSASTAFFIIPFFLFFYQILIFVKLRTSFLENLVIVQSRCMYQRVRCSSMRWWYWDRRKAPFLAITWICTVSLQFYKLTHYKYSINSNSRLASTYYKITIGVSMYTKYINKGSLNITIKVQKRNILVYPFDIL